MTNEELKNDEVTDDRAGRYQEVYGRMYGVAPPAQGQQGSSNADILSPARGFMGGFDFTMQLQVGCPGGCLFCYVPAGRFLAPSAVCGPQGKDWGFQVRTKEQAIPRLVRYLHATGLADKTLYWSGITDPYASSPTLTRTLWQTLLDSPIPLRPKRIVVQTRFRADRDAEIMAAYAKTTCPTDGGPAVAISFSVGTDRADLIRAWEHATPGFEQRVEAITTLRQAGLCVVATLSPFGLWNDLTGTMAHLKTLGVAYITILFFKENTTSANTPKHFLAYLRAEHPQLLDSRWQAERLAEVQTVFGAERVLVGQAGFASLAAPHRIAESAKG